MSDEALSYLRQTELLAALNRVVNRVVKERPSDPFARASELLAGATAVTSPSADSSAAKVAELEAELAVSETRAAKVAALEADLAASTNRVAALELERGERAMQLSDAEEEACRMRRVLELGSSDWLVVTQRLGSADAELRDVAREIEGGVGVNDAARARVGELKEEHERDVAGVALGDDADMQARER